MTKTDPDTKIKVLEAYEKRLVNYDHERAVVIAKDGSVYEVIGTSGHVYPECLGKAVLEDAFVTHNHPEHETEYTFSKTDLSFFSDFRLNTLRGVDNAFVYQVANSGAATVKDFDYYNWYDVLNGRHAMMTDEYLHRNLNYWRKKK